MSELIHRLTSAVRDLTADSRIWVGLSGGLDSVTLLHALLKAGVAAGRIQALHVHHGLSANADDWQSFCQQLCDQLGVSLISRKVVLTDSGNGTEFDARAARYEAFGSLVGEGEVLLLAHHGDDQIETFFQRLFRGAGLGGLSAIKSERLLGAALPQKATEQTTTGQKPADQANDSAGIRILRPWLDIPRRELEAWAESEGLSWIHDESNDDTRFERNWWRHELLPQVFARFPGKQKALLRSVNQLAQDQAVLTKLIRPHTDNCIMACSWPHTLPLSCNLEALGAVDADIVPYILRDWLGRLNLMLPSANWLDTLIRDVIHAAEDKQPELALGAFTLRRYRAALFVVADELPHPIAELADAQSLLNVEPLAFSAPAQPGVTQQLPLWDGSVLQVTLAADDGAHSAGHIMAGHIMAGHIMAGDYRVLPAVQLRGHKIQAAGRPAKTLKAVFQEAGVPVWLRDSWPALVLWDDLPDEEQSKEKGEEQAAPASMHLVALPGLICAAQYSPGSAEPLADNPANSKDTAGQSWSVRWGGHNLLPD